MKIKKYRYFVGDFETTVYNGQQATEVWASASVELYTEDVHVFHSIDEQFNYFKSLGTNVVAYYHNLKFDGSFWLSYLMIDLGFQQACEKLNEEGTEVAWLKDKEMKNNTFKYSISDRGQWYTIIIKVGGHFIEIRDSLKLLPFSVKEIGSSFKTKHQKLDMEYTGFRYAGCAITDEEKKYIANDVLVVKEALEFMFKQGNTKLTIGACCLAEYKNLISKDEFNELFPSMTDIAIDEEAYGMPTVDGYVRRSYKGGWCYLVEEKAGKVYKKGATADVNSLYPSVMSSESGNRYPIGYPTFWKGNYIPDKALQDDKYFFIRIRTKFYLKKDKLPFIQIKGTMLYPATKSLRTSDVYDKSTGKYYDKYIDENGNVKDTRVTLTLTTTDYILFLEHYDVKDFEILDGCWFFAETGIFDRYIEKYKKIKMTSKGAVRQLAKLYLNNLYGKMASNDNSSFKLAYVKADKTIGFIQVAEHNKKAGYIPVGSAITSYARNFTIRAAQKNYHGVDKPGFIYADTDSIHCDLPTSDFKGIKVHPTNFCCWKLETTWDRAIFTRQKTYIEHVIEEDLVPIDTPYDNIKCAGMPDKCKDLLEMSITQEYDKNELTETELQFVQKKRSYNDFKIGLKVPGKLLPKRIPGGVLLTETTYEMR